MGQAWAADTNKEIGQRIQQQYEFYMLGLVFTLLGLSVQTARFGTSDVSDACELIAWVALLISALAMMSRLTWAPNIYTLFHHQAKLNADKAQSSTSQTADIDNQLNAVTDGIKNLNARARLKLTVHRYTFLLGLVLLLVSRGYVPGKKLVLAVLFSS